MNPHRAKNDCVPWFFSAATCHFIGQGKSSADVFRMFADSIDVTWRQTKALPSLSEYQVIEHFKRVSTVSALDLSLRVERFRNIPYDLYFERAQELWAKGHYVGIGYRSRYIFGSTGADLHVSAVSAATASGVYLIDHDIDRDQHFTWETIEAAVISADSGFWVVSANK